jgi:hypothetical protein
MQLRPIAPAQKPLVTTRVAMYDSRHMKYKSNPNETRLTRVLVIPASRASMTLFLVARWTSISLTRLVAMAIQTLLHLAMAVRQLIQENFPVTFGG